MRRWVGIAAISLLIVFPMPRAGAAGLTYDQLNPKRHTKVVPVPQMGTVVASVSCPKGTTLLTGGAFLSAASVNVNGPDPSLAQTSYLTSSFPTSRSGIQRKRQHLLHRVDRVLPPVTSRRTGASVRMAVA